MGKQHSIWVEHGGSFTSLLKRLDEQMRDRKVDREVVLRQVATALASDERRPQRSQKAMKEAWRRWSQGGNKPRFPQVDEARHFLTVGIKQKWVDYVWTRDAQDLLLKLPRAKSWPPALPRDRPLGSEQPDTREETARLRKELEFSNSVAANLVKGIRPHIDSSKTGKPSQAKALAVFRASTTQVVAAAVLAINNQGGGAFATTRLWPYMLRGTARDISKLMYLAARAIERGEPLEPIASQAIESLIAHVGSSQFETYRERSANEV